MDILFDTSRVPFSTHSLLTLLYDNQRAVSFHASQQVHLRSSTHVRVSVTRVGEGYSFEIRYGTLAGEQFMPSGEAEIMNSSQLASLARV